MAKSDRDQQAGQIFGSRQHELKLGKSFQEDNSCGFHTIRYDFKPASVDYSREAALDVGESNEVNITFPNAENKGSTVFGGSKKPYQKECVLIFDHRTGEFTLERLSCNIQVKRLRQEGTSKAQKPPKGQQASGSKSSPNPRSSSQASSKSSPNPRSSSQASGSKSSPNPRSNSQGNKKKDTPLNSPAQQAERRVERSPAPQPSPLAASEPSPAPPSVPSVIDKEADSSDGYMSASDSDDDSSSSSGSSSSDNDEDDDDSDRDAGARRIEQATERVSSKLSPAQPSPVSRLLNVSPLLTLSEDLQLSESGSDSDSD